MLQYPENRIPTIFSYYRPQVTVKQTRDTSEPVQLKVKGERVLKEKTNINNLCNLMIVKCAVDNERKNERTKQRKVGREREKKKQSNSTNTSICGQLNRRGNMQSHQLCDERAI